MLRPLTRRIVRRVGNLVVAWTPDGIEIKGIHKRRWKKFSWDLILSLDLDSSGSLIRTMEEKIGRRIREEMTRPTREPRR